ncbi:MAG TPA: UDP-forming cellulose synthase catalytic subunit [Bryobacteraceae bacterium]|jgi:cellulose synthase (UDP-forming)|nr:UDP-forming cellulose synthase catalytic subunit [Bryobacteraceae bacterium]
MIVLLWLASAVILALLAIVPLDWKSQAELGLVLVALSMVLGHISPKRRMTLALIAISIFSSTRYIYWRIAETARVLHSDPGGVPALDLVFVFLLLSAEVYAFMILVLGYVQTVCPLKRPPLPLPADRNSWPEVDIYIPTYNEPLEVVRPTVLAALSVDWPSEKLRVHILDDGHRPQFRAFAEEAGCVYITRPDNRHAKAGNINYALKQTSAPYIAIFDCDHIPTRSFLQVTMGWFLKDPRLSMLQTPHHFYSPDPFERNLDIFREVPNEGALFYGMVQDGNDFWNSTFFCGSCAVIRREALEEIGGVAVETVTEDAHTSLRMQRLGWNTAYINIPQAAGLATGSLAAHIGQRIRWARGMVQILRTDCPLFGHGLKFCQRLCYFNAVIHFLYAVPRLIFLTSPLIYLLFGRSNLLGYVGAIVAYAFPHLVLATVTNARIQGRYRHSFWNEVYETILAPYILLPTTVALIDPKRGKFNVTSKGSVMDSSFFDWHIARPYIFLFALNLAGMGVAIFRLANHAAPVGTVLINLVWSGFNSIILGASVAVADESRQRRSSVRITARIPLQLLLPDGKIVPTEMEDISSGGVKLHPQEPCSLQPGQVGSLAMQSEVEPFAVTVVDNSRGTLRLRFKEMSLARESQLVAVIYGRADSWISWRAGRPDDRPMRSFIEIAGYSAQGLAAMLKAIFSRRRPVNDADALARQPILPLIPILACLVLLAPAASAQTHAGASAQPKRSTSSLDTSPIFSDSYDLSLLGEKQPLMMHGAEASSQVFFRIPLTKVVTQARLDLRYRVSPNLAPGVSQIHVVLNGTPVGSIPISQSKAEPESLISAALDLPADLLTDENALSFQLMGKCTGCDDEAQTDLWTRIELTTELHLSGSVLALANDLRLLPAPFFDSSLQRAIQVPFVFAQAPGERELEAAGVIASWFGILADYRDIGFPISVGRIPPGNVVAIAGNRSDLMVGLGLGDTRGPSLAMRDNPSDRYGKILLVTGDDGGQIVAAARGLTLGKPRSGDSATLDGADIPPPREPYDAPRWLSTDGKARLGQFTSPEQLHVMGNGTVRLFFRLPPDLYFEQRITVPLELVYRSKGLPPRNGKKSIVSVSLNGVFVASKPINAKSLQGPYRQIIPLPVTGLSPNNTLTIDFSFGAKDADTISGYTEATVLGDSELEIEGIPHFVAMPRLDLYANSGFPFTRLADLAETAVVLPQNPDADQIETYLQLLAFFGARTGYPGLRITVLGPSQVAGVRKKDLLVVSGMDSGDLPESWEGSLGLQRRQNKLSVTDKRSLLSLLPWTTAARGRTNLENQLNGRVLPDVVLQELASPADPQRVVTLIQTAVKPERSPLRTIFEGGAGVSRIFGDVSIYQNGRFHSFQIRPPSYYLGHLAWHDHFDFWVGRYFLIIPGVLLIFALIFAVAFDAWLVRRTKWRLQLES